MGRKKKHLIWYTDPSIYNTVWGHTGGWFGCETALFLCKEEKWGIIFFINWATPPNGWSSNGLLLIWLNMRIYMAKFMHVDHLSINHMLGKI